METGKVLQTKDSPTGKFFLNASVTESNRLAAASIGALSARMDVAEAGQRRAISRSKNRNSRLRSLWHVISELF
jgi:hypothetical protein